MKFSCLHLHIIVERLPCDANVPDPELRRWRKVDGLTFTVTPMATVDIRRQSHASIPRNSELICTLLYISCRIDDDAHPEKFNAKSSHMLLRIASLLSVLILQLAFYSFLLNCC